MQSVAFSTEILFYCNRLGDGLHEFLENSFQRQCDESLQLVANGISTYIWKLAMGCATGCSDQLQKIFFVYATYRETSCRADRRSVFQRIKFECNWLRNQSPNQLQNFIRFRFSTIGDGLRNPSHDQLQHRLSK